MNGCFDVLGYGHFKLIEHAASLGDDVVIGIDTDRRVKILKGDTRPFHTAEERRFNLLSIRGVNRVIIFDTADELSEIIEAEAPDIFLIGDDYFGRPIIGAEYAKEIHYFPRQERLSTTKILENDKEDIGNW